MVDLELIISWLLGCILAVIAMYCTRGKYGVLMVFVYIVIFTFIVNYAMENQEFF